MTAYIDSSVLLRILLGQKGQLAEWPKIRRFVSSALLATECLRTLDRLRHIGALDAQGYQSGCIALRACIAGAHIAPVSAGILEHASHPLPGPLGTLDAIHLATALQWRERRDRDLVLATHDLALARAAQSLGLPVIGA